MIQAISLIALVAVFAIATVAPINMGILAFVAAFVVGALSGVTVDDIVGFFPGNVFVLVVGITLLFGVASVNGTLDLIVSASLRLVRGRRWAVVWLMFVLSAILMALGSVLAVGMLAPIAMPIAARYRINPLLMGMMLSHGAQSAVFSPITVYGAFAANVVTEAGIQVSPLTMFLVPFALNLLLAVVLFAVLGRGLLARGSADDRIDLGGSGQRTASEASATAGSTVTGTPSTPVSGTVATAMLASAAPAVTDGGGIRVTPRQALTLLGMLGLLTAAFLGVDPGVTAFVIGALLLLVAPFKHQDSMTKVSWPAVLLVCGMLSYMAVLKENGTLAMVGEAATALGSPLLAALLLCFGVAILSAFGSSIGTLGIALPLAFPLIEAGGIGAAGFVIALGFCTTVVDVSPFSTSGIIVLAQAQVEDKQVFQRRMLAYAALIVLVAPLLAWLVTILPTS